MKKKYWTLFTRETGCNWGPEFGDYERSAVEAEKLYYRDRGYKASDLVIKETGDTQAEIMAVRDWLDANKA